MDGSEGIQFNEFIVLLCLIYLLKDQPSSSSSQNVSTINLVSLILLHFKVHYSISFNLVMISNSFLYIFQTSKMGSPELEATFDTIIEVFLFLDKNGNGKLNKKDMVKALNDSSTSERSPAHITRSRFSTSCFSLLITFASNSIV